MDVMNMEEEMVLRSLDPGQRSAGSTLEYRGSNVSWQHVLECGGWLKPWLAPSSILPSTGFQFTMQIVPPQNISRFIWLPTSHGAMFSQYVLQNAQPFHFKMLLSLALLWWWKSPANCKTWQQRDYCCKREFQKVANPGELRCQWYHSVGSCDLGNGQS